MLASIANADEELRHLGLIDSLIGEWAEDKPHRERELDGVKSAASKGDYSFLSPLVEDWLQSNGYDLSAGSPDFKLTEREFGKTLQQAVAIEAKRDDGEFVESPIAPAKKETEAGHCKDH